MQYLREDKPIWHAMVWIAVYVALVNVGDLLSSQLPAAIPVTGILLGCLFVALWVYLKMTGLMGSFGMRRPDIATMPLVLYLVPLFAVALLQFSKGLVPNLDATAVLSACLLVASVGFIEELLFRGFLFQALLKKGNRTRAILISGVTFGIGHIVNLTRGSSGPEQLIQVIAAVVIGIALAYCVALTGSIIPGAIFHALFNLSGTLTNHDVGRDMYIVAAIIVVLIPYIIFLRGTLARIQAQPILAPASADATLSAGGA